MGDHGTDPAWKRDPLRVERPHTITVQTVGYDPDRAGIGSGPGGDTSNNVLQVPQFVPNTGERFLFRLAAHRVPAGYYAALLDACQVVTIAQPFTVVDGQQAPLFTSFIEREVVSPFWCFTDGNVCTGITRLAMGDVQNDWGATTTLPLVNPSVSNSLYDVSPALLALGDVTAAAYRAPFGGQYPGDDIAGLIRFYDQRYPWNLGSTLRQRFVVHGPAVIVMWASVLQTDPLTRPQIPAASLPQAPATLAGWRPEDQFLYSFGDAGAQGPNRVRYRKIGGRMLIETGPAEFLCMDDRRRAKLVKRILSQREFHIPPTQGPSVPGETLT
jgi:hypothetical protein